MRVTIDEDQVNLNPSLSHGAFKEAGQYSLNVTDPRKYHDLLGQMEKVASNTSSIKFEIGLSDEEIPLHYAMKNLHFNLDSDAGITKESAVVARRIFTKRHPEKIMDYASSDALQDGHKILLPYNGQRMDEAIGQFFYYTKTPFDALQPFVIFSNYNQYVSDIYEYGLKELFNQSVNPEEPHIIAVVCTGKDVAIKEGLSESQIEELKAIKSNTERKGLKGAQMPSCHLMMSDGIGISLINSGVGAPNTVNIADLVAPKRSHGWIMAGHTAGISPTLSVGDYVFADNYFINAMTVNDQGTGFDYTNMRAINAAPSSEMQRAVRDSINGYCERTGLRADQIYRRAAVVSTDYRRWERDVRILKEIHKTNAAVLEMETGQLALKAREQSIPFAAFLKASDLPHHDQPKAPAMADDFFGEVGSHLGIIIESIHRLKRDHMDSMHSRKFRPVSGGGAFVFQ